MSWFDVIKRGKPKAKPFNPFTGKGLRVSEIAERKKTKQEERIKTEEEKPNKIPIGRVHHKFGGNSSFSREGLNRAKVRGQEKQHLKNDKSKHSFNPESRCAKCTNPISRGQRTLTRNNASNLKYCEPCAKSIEEKR